MQNDKDKRSDFVTGFARGLAVIESFSSDSRRQTLSQVAVRARVDRAVARRLLLTLTELGFVSTDGKQFELTPKILRLGASFLSAAGFDRAVQACIDDLSRELSENVSVTVLDFPDVVNVARAEARTHAPQVSISVSGRLPALYSASGRLLLSCLDDEEIRTHIGATRLVAYTNQTITDPAALFSAVTLNRTRDYSLILGELAPGYVAVSTPIRRSSGAIVAAINVGTHSSRATKKRLEGEIVPALKRCALQIAPFML